MARASRQGRQALAYPDPVAPLLDPTLKDQWDNDGWCVVEGIIPPAKLVAAQDAVRRLFPTPTEMADEQDAERASGGHGTPNGPSFPSTAPA